MAIILRTDGTQEVCQPKNGTDFQLDEVKAVVNGWVEMVGLADGRIMLLNEEGKLHDLPVNAAATELFNQGGRMWYDWIVGDVLVCNDEEFL